MNEEGCWNDFARESKSTFDDIFLTFTLALSCRKMRHRTHGTADP